MIFKIIMLLVSVFSMLTSAVFPAPPAAELLEDPTLAEGFVTSQALATRSIGGTAFSRISVIWAEMNDRRLDEDAWGTGQLDSLTFKVGLKAADGRTLTVGDEAFDLKPTDTITIRDFSGRFAVAGTGTPDMTISLDGQVKATTFKDGRVRAVQTSVDGDESRLGVNASALKPDTRNRIAYVVLGGKSMDTVSVDTSVAREVATRDLTPGRANATDPASSILARWVKIDGELVREYRWGEGALDTIQFAVADNAGDVRVSYNRNEIPLKPGQIITIKNFLGTYVLFQVKDAFKLKLDGFAESTTTSDHNPLGEATGNLAPSSRFGWTPANPTTSDYVQFVDYSTDADGTLVLRTWNFGDGPVASYPQVDGVNPDAPRHRYQKPGTYAVQLTVTDNNLATDTIVQNLTIFNTLPVAAFDWAPKQAATREAIQFFDKSWDADGRIVDWRWDFGDGTVPVSARDPKHAYQGNGKYNVTLTVTDADGGQAKASHVVRVLNLPPIADFTWTPANPRAGELVSFRDDSTDPDGVVVDWRWEFSTNPPVIQTGTNPTLSFPRAGNFRVKLTVTDDDGGTNTVYRNVTVQNSPPLASWRIQYPAVPVTGDSVQFEDLSVDADGSIASRIWNFGDGQTSTLPNPQHTYDTNRSYRVRLTVTDNLGATDYEERNITIGNAAPTVGFLYQPSNPFTSETVLFTDTSTDRDGDTTLTSWLWRFGDGNTSTDRFTTWSYQRPGIYEVSLTVTDDAGNTAEVRKPVHVLNRPPTASFTLTPGRPVALEPVQFVPDVFDPDGFIVSYLWDFQEATSTLQNPTHAFTRSGTYNVILTVVDNDGDQGSFAREITVLHAPPQVNFNWTPLVPTAETPVQFTDLSVPTEGQVTQWNWDFGDSGRSSAANPTHTYAQSGTYAVRLLVTDSSGSTGAVTKSLTVNAPPTASFTTTPSFPLIRQNTGFVSTSTDSDGVIVTQEWNVGGILYYGRYVNHTFETPGSVLVTLTVVDDNGGTSTATRTYNIRNLPPSPSFTVSPWPVQGEPVTFTDTSTDSEGHVANRTWDFGDGNISFAPFANHTYEVSGIYRVLLRVTDNDGAVASSFRNIRVTGDFAKTLEYRVVYPDGSPLDLSRTDVIIDALSTNGTRWAKGAMNLTNAADGRVRITLTPESWTTGELVTMTTRLSGITSQPRSLAITLDATSLFQAATLNLVVDVAFRSNVTMMRATTQGLVDFADYNWNAPVYGNQSEPVYFKVKVTWLDGKPVKNATVFPRLTYNVFWGEFLDLGAVQQLTQTVAQNTTDANGEAIFLAPYWVRTPFGTLTTPEGFLVQQTLQAPGFYKPGAYRVFGKATLGSLVHESSARFYEDPFGVMTGVLSNTP